MHKPFILFFVFWAAVYGVTLPAATVTSPVIAKVNGDPIVEEDLLKAQPNQDSTGTREDKLKRAIQFRLMVQEAKKRGLDRAPEVQAELNQILYRKLIQDELNSKKKSLSPSESDLQSYYNQFPLLRIHHLVLNKRTESEKQVANLALEQIQKGLKKGTPFEKLCTQFSQDASAIFGGDADFRGIHNFPTELYTQIRALGKNAVSDPIEIGNAVHLFQWFEKKSFTNAPASYLQFLQSRLEKEREQVMVARILKDLELKAVIEPPSLAIGNR